MTHAPAQQRNAANGFRWFWAVLVVGIMYLAAGLVFASLARTAGTSQARVAWRLTAWALSTLAFSAQVWYEQARLRRTAVTTALHASLSVGAFALAVFATLHAQTVHKPFPAFALAVWPVMTALPAFVVALGLAVALPRLRRRA